MLGDSPESGWGVCGGVETFLDTHVVPEGGIRPLREVWFGFGGAGWSWELQFLESPKPISDSKLGRGVFPSRASALLEEGFMELHGEVWRTRKKNKTQNS